MDLGWDRLWAPAQKNEAHVHSQAYWGPSSYDHLKFPHKYVGLSIVWRSLKKHAQAYWGPSRYDHLKFPKKYVGLSIVWRSLKKF